MPISFNEKTRQFRLSALSSDYIMTIAPGGYLAHVWLGEHIPDDDLSYLLRLDEPPFTPESNDRDRSSYMDVLPAEFPCFGVGDYREHALSICGEGGTSTCDMVYKSHRIIDGKPPLEGLPATFAADNSPCSTLEVTLEDKAAQLEAVLLYTVFENVNAFTRSVRIRNTGDKPCTLTRVYSACIDLDRSDYDMITLNGSWARERIPDRCRLHHGKQSVDSVRGTSSHQHNPFTALCSHNADEDTGEVLGFNLVYSGSFVSLAEVDQHERTRYVIGINDTDFSWELVPGGEFTAPEAVIVYSDKGLGGMSRAFHYLYRNNLIRGKYRDIRRPVLINNWEATYFDFNTEKLLGIARQASELGIELLVVDDGWFGHRSSDNSSLGDWIVNEEKLPGGFAYLSGELKKLGMKLGVWFEPEMISPDSRLYREHPDWAIQVPGRRLTMSREQYVLDYSRPEVREHIWGMMKNVLDSADISYIKWDMNRQITEAGSAALPPGRQKELWHRYVLGVYDMMNRLTTEYPDILLENCSGGGARFDPGMLYYSPQIWCSDDTDAAERLKIQYGTSLCYPCSSIGAHVSVCPNHTVGRNTSFTMRGHAALAGTFGYELDPTRLSDEERAAIPEQIEDFRRFNHLVRNGDYYRIGNIFSDNTWDCYEFAAADRSEAIAVYFQVLARPNYASRRVRLKGLDQAAYYYEESAPEKLYSGAALMSCGINIGGLWGDYQSRLLHFISK
ncbi:MAG: alpha-galactosidase [Ruminococcus sp.]|nr:alpha-galactosidase [Ruminococcus sp.]